MLKCTLLEILLVHWFYTRHTEFLVVWFSHHHKKKETITNSLDSDGRINELLLQRCVVTTTNCCDSDLLKQTPTLQSVAWSIVEATQYHCAIAVCEQHSGGKPKQS